MFDAWSRTRPQIVTPGRVVVRRRFASVGFFGKSARSGALSKFISAAMEEAARSLLDAGESMLEEASSTDVRDLSRLFGLVTCSADAKCLRDGEVSVAAVVADEQQRLFGEGRALFRYRASAVSDRWAREWWER